MQTRHGVLGGALVVALLLATGGCRNVHRPSVEEWRPLWADAQTAVPARAALDGTNDRTLCDHSLSELRAERLSVLPSPSEDLDQVVIDWLEQAEDMMFDCPDEGGPNAGFDAGYRELERLAQRIEFALRIGATKAD
jgi:hypothetical protein